MYVRELFLSYLFFRLNFLYIVLRQRLRQHPARKNSINIKDSEVAEFPVVSLWIALGKERTFVLIKKTASFVRISDFHVVHGSTLISSYRLLFY